MYVNLLKVACETLNERIFSLFRIQNSTEYFVGTLQKVLFNFHDFFQIK